MIRQKSESQMVTRPCIITWRLPSRASHMTHHDSSLGRVCDMLGTSPSPPPPSQSSGEHPPSVKPGTTTPDVRRWPPPRSRPTSDQVMIICPRRPPPPPGQEGCDLCRRPRPIRPGPGRGRGGEWWARTWRTRGQPAVDLGRFPEASEIPGRESWLGKQG